jgi:hypothetical protein
MFRCDEWGGQPPEPCGPPGKAKLHEVSYRVTGSALGTVAISLRAPGGHRIESVDHALPWSTTWNVDWSDEPQLILRATASQVSGTRTLKCEILVDAEVVATDTATGRDQDVDCRIPVGYSG